MQRLTRWLAPLALASPFVLGGCGGAGKEDVGATSNAENEKPAPNQKNIAQDDKSGGVASKKMTPDSAIDPDKVVDVVKAEVKGGEASKGPTRTDHLFAYPDLKAIADEPVEDVEVPRGLPALTVGVYVPAANPITKGKIELGKQLYFDPRLSKNTTVSCATCHNPEKGWTDNLPTSVGIFGQTGARNAPTVLNTAYGKTQFWDGRAPSLEGQAQGPVQNKIEMGDQSYEEIIDRLRTIPGYKEQFKKVFGTDVTLDGVAKAIATFERVAALSGGSPYDNYQNSDIENHTTLLNESQKRGMILFGLALHPDDQFKTEAVRGKANCTKCHAGFNFTDEQFHNIGVGWSPAENGFKDPGRWGVTPPGSKNPAELGSFKTPTCRDIAKTGPYMHDGSEKTLEDVVNYYDRGGNPNPTLDPNMKPLKLSPEEKADLVHFLEALTGTPTKVALPTLPPGPDGKAPDPKAALEIPAKQTALTGHEVLGR